jgi:hypothetical protein
MQKYKTKLIQLLLWLAFATTFVSGENPRSVESVIAAETNVAFVGVSMHNVETRKAVEYLKRENLTQSADIKPPEFFEFSFDGETNCPLTIILNFNFAPSGALQYLEKPLSNKSETKIGSRISWKNTKTQSA